MLRRNATNSADIVLSLEECGRCGTTDVTVLEMGVGNLNTTNMVKT